MRRKTTVWLAAALLVLLVAGGMAAWILMPNRSGANPTDPAQVALGKTVYGENCASCHGARLEGQPNWRDPKPDGRLPAPPHDAEGHTWHHPQDMLFRITRDGIAAVAPKGYKSDMPAFGQTLTDEQIRAVLAFIASRWPKDIRTRWAALPEQPAQ